MSKWLPDISSHKFQLAATAAAAGAVSISAVLAFQRIRRQHKVDDLKASIPDIGRDHPATKLTEYGGASEHFALSKEDERGLTLAARARKGDYDNELIQEQLARNRVFLTEAGLEKVRSAFVIVVGCGGVGSHAATALARSGVSKIRLIDFDQVTLSSLNRHAVATLADVGTPKVHCIRRRLEQVAPWVHFDCRNELFSATAAPRQFAPFDGQLPAYVVDAIDNIDSKVALLKYCHEHGLPVVASMGAGCKSDPTRVLVGDISATTDDPLSKSTRRRLRALGITSGIPAVFSTEKPGPGKAQLLPLPEEEVGKGKVGELGVLPDFRVRILPVLGTMPAIFGLAAANHVLLELAGYPRAYLPSRAREKMYDGMHGALQGSEERLAKGETGGPVIGLRLPLTVDDVGYLVEEVYAARSVVSNVPTRLALVRWKRPSGGTIDGSVEGQKVAKLKLRDLVCMTKEEATKHEREVLKGERSAEEVWGEEVVKRVEAKLEEEKSYERFR